MAIANSKASSTIVALNIPDGITKDDLTIHFQGKSSGGGDVDDVVMLPDGSDAFIIFDDDDAVSVVENVLKKQQIVQGKLIEVQRYESWKNRRKDKEENHSDGITTVYVSNIKESTTNDTVSLFFENKKRSSGGELKDFERLGPTEARLTFSSAKDAGEVLIRSTQLYVEGSQLKITTNREVTHSKSIFIVEKLSADTKEETLRNYMEATTSVRVDKIVFGQDDKAVVILEKEADGQCIKKFEERKLRGSQISFAPLTHAIRVSRIPSSTTSSELIFKFSNSVIGGGPVTDLMFDKKIGAANIYFEDHLVASALLKRKHELNGAELMVSPYYDGFHELPEETNTMEEYSWKIPMSRDVIDFITARHDIKSKYDLKSMNFDQGEEILHLSKELENPPEAEHVGKEINFFLYSFVRESINIPKHISRKVEEKCDEFQDAKTLVKYSDATLILIGNQEHVENKKQEISRFVDHLQEQLIPEQLEFSIDENAKDKLVFLNFIRYSSKLMIEYPNVHIAIDGTSQKVTGIGTKESTKDIRIRILEDLQAVTETNVNMSKRQTEFLRRTDCKLVNDRFTKQDTNAMLYLKAIRTPGSAKVWQAKLMILKMSTEELKSHENIVFEMTFEKALDVDKSTLDFLSTSGKLKALQEKQLEKYGVTVEPESTAPSKIWIIGEMAEVENAFVEAKELIRSNSIKTTTFDTNEIKVRLIKSHLWDQFQEIAKRLAPEGVELYILPLPSGSISVRGTETGIKKATTSLKSLSEQVVSRVYKLEEPGMKKLVSLNSTAGMIDMVEKQNKCIIELYTQPGDLDSSRDEPVMMGVKAKDTTVADVPEVILPRLDADCLLFVSDQEIRCKAGQRISVVVGDLSQQTVDVIVNTTNDQLDLNANPCGKALLQVAGEGLQEECKKIGNLAIANIAVTKGGQLNCKLVYHVNCAGWGKGKGESVLRRILKTCLNQIHESDKLTSISFPAIGTGKLGFPHDVVAKIFFEEVVHFLTSNPKTTLNDIRFVAYSRDQLSIDAFKNMISVLKSINSADDSGKDDNSKKSSNLVLGQLKENADGCLEISLGKGLTIQISSGDITKETTEVIMHVTNQRLSLSGGVAKALTKVGGEAIIKECKQISAQVPLPLIPSVHFTGSGNLSVSQIAHVVAPDQPTIAQLKESLEMFFDEISKKKTKQVSFSAIGSGAIGLTEAQSVDMIFAALSKVSGRVNADLNLVRIVIFEKDKFKNFIAAVKLRFERGQNSSSATTKDTGYTSIYQKLKDRVLSLASTETRSRFGKIDNNESFRIGQHCVKIHAAKNSLIDTAWSDFRAKLNEHIGTQPVNDDNIKKLSKEEIEEIESMKKKYDVEISVDKNIGRVTVKGYSSDVANVMAKIHQVIKERMSKENKRPPLPKNWDPQPTDDNKKERAFYRVKLKSSSREYSSVEKHFKKTAKQKIVKIERIQNAPKYRSYVAAKEEKSKVTEKYLFHGTKAENIDSINHDGWNRSYAGTNGTAFGRGVYFARDASYSCDPKFSPRDNKGYGYVYYARVAVGEYTRGTSQMIVPPFKNDKNDPNAKFDLVVNDIINPSIFVLFYDREHYPEYLITFTD